MLPMLSVLLFWVVSSLAWPLYDRAAQSGSSSEDGLERERADPPAWSNRRAAIGRGMEIENVQAVRKCVQTVYDAAWMLSVQS